MCGNHRLLLSMVETYPAFTERKQSFNGVVAFTRLRVKILAFLQLTVNFSINFHCFEKLIIN